MWALTEDEDGRSVVLRLDRRTGRLTADPMGAGGAPALGWVAEIGRGTAEQRTVRVATRPALRPAA